MKKWLLSLFLVVGLLVGCSNDATDSSEDITDPIDVTVIISLDNDNERLVDENITVNDGAILIDVLTERYDVEKTSDGFIEGLEGHSQDAPRYWFFDVNGEPSPVGAADVELSDGDEIHFDLHEWEG